MVSHHIWNAFLKMSISKNASNIHIPINFSIHLLLDSNALLKKNKNNNNENCTKIFGSLQSTYKLN